MLITSYSEMKLNLKSIYDGHLKVKYRSVPAYRSPFEYVIYQMIISELKPDLVIEIGTRFGGNTYYLADLLDNIGHGQIHTIDIIDSIYEEARQHPRIKCFLGGWEAYDIANTSDFEIILVIEDGSHMYDSCLGALHKFAPLVTENSYLIVEDGIIDALGMKKKFNGGPVKAIEEFLPQHRNFHIDDSWCNFFGASTTFNTKGYLKKRTQYTEMEWTGERLVTTHMSTTTIEHLHRYALAGGLVSNKSVIDIASGEGYGSNLLAKNASTVLSVDIPSGDDVNEGPTQYSIHPDALVSLTAPKKCVLQRARLFLKAHDAASSDLSHLAEIISSCRHYLGGRFISAKLVEQFKERADLKHWKDTFDQVKMRSPQYVDLGRVGDIVADDLDDDGNKE